MRGELMAEVQEHRRDNACSIAYARVIVGLVN